MAEKRAKRSDTSKHNTDHKNNQTPDRRAKPKAKTGPYVLNIMLFIEMSKHPMIDQRLKQKPDLRLRGILMHCQQYHHSLQEKKHLGTKINQNMLILNRNTHLKEHQVGHEIIKDHLLFQHNNNKNETTKPTRPDHDTEQDENRTKTHWRKATKGYLVDQSSEHGWKLQKTQNGKMQKFHKKELAQIMIDLLGL